jgi:hypothetical protein
MRLALVFAGCAALLGCVSAPTEAPKLTEAQNERVRYVDIYQTGQTPGQKYSVIGPVEAAACSASAVFDILKRQTVALGGDAVVEASCGNAKVSNCTAGRKCTGNVVRWNEN